MNTNTDPLPSLNRDQLVGLVREVLRERALDPRTKLQEIGAQGRQDFTGFSFDLSNFHKDCVEREGSEVVEIHMRGTWGFIWCRCCRKGGDAEAMGDRIVWAECCESSKNDSVPLRRIV